jgi:hypothetical protein
VTEDRKEPRREAGAMAEAASLAAAIERWSADLALGEEPARFLSALEDGAL